MQLTPKLVKRPLLGKERAQKQHIRWHHVYMIIWKPLVGECLQCVKEPINKMDKDVVAVVRTNSHCQEEVVSHVQQKSPWLYPCFYSCSTALWTSLLQLGNTSNMEVNTNWNFLGIFISMNLKGPLNYTAWKVSGKCGKIRTRITPNTNTFKQC